MTTALRPITVRINRAVPSGNKSTFQHWRDYAKERDIWATLIRAKLAPKQKPAHRVGIHFTAYRVRICDRINNAHGFKAVLDALVNLGWLFDDSEAWLDDTYGQVKCPLLFVGAVIRIENP